MPLTIVEAFPNGKILKQLRTSHSTLPSVIRPLIYHLSLHVLPMVARMTSTGIVFFTRSMTRQQNEASIKGLCSWFPITTSQSCSRRFWSGWSQQAESATPRSWKQHALRFLPGRRLLWADTSFRSWVLYSPSRCMLTSAPSYTTRSRLLRAPHPAFPLQGLSSSPLAATLMTVSPINAYQPTGSWSSLMHFMPSISELRTVFETLLLCKSVVVLAKSPQSCSECVSLLLDMIRPVPYAGVVRPYVTMQSDFTALGLDGGLPHSYIAGVTNPFLLQRLLTAPKNKDRSKPHVVYLHHQFDNVPPMKSQSLRHQRSHPEFDVPGGLELEASTKKYTKADNTFHKELNRMLRREPSDIDEVDSIIRHHFAELAAQFVAPINRYLATSMSSSVISPGGNLQYGNFNEADFLHSLSKHGTAVNFKGQTPLQKHRARDAMYTDFCRSSNFYSWLDMKLSLEKESVAGLLISRAPG